MSNSDDPVASLRDYNPEKNLLRNAKIFRLVFVQFFFIGLFANILFPQACFCGEACLHGIPGKTWARLIFPFHPRCAGTQCRSCNLENVQTLKASNAAHWTKQRNTLKTPYIFSNFSDHRFNVHFIKFFPSRFTKYVKVQSPPTYLQNLCLLF